MNQIILQNGKSYKLGWLRGLDSVVRDELSRGEAVEWNPQGPQNAATHKPG